MKEEHVEKSLENLAQSIPVNKKLKRRLYQKYLFQTYRKFGTAIVAGLLMLVLIPTMLFQSPSVKASDLKIGKYVAVTNLEPGTPGGVSEYKGIVFMPYPGKGILKREGDNLTTIYEGTVNWVQVSPSGKQLVFSEEGSLKLLDLSSNQTTSLLTGNENLLYLQPSWQSDNAIFFTRQEISPGKVTSAIYSLDLKTLKEQIIALGSYPSYLKGRNALVYEYEDQIIFRDLQAGTESVIDHGNQPQASPNGRYIAYTKYAIEREELQKNIEREEIVQNVWVVNAEDFSDQNKITDNFVLKTIDEQEWLNSLQPTDEVQVLSFGGRYSYFYPSWSSDSQSLYFPRRDFQASREPIAPQLIRVDFMSKAFSAQETVEQYLQAIAAENYDYASGLSQQSFLEEQYGQHQLLAYKVIGMGRENNLEYVDVQLTWSKDEGTLTETHRFYLRKDRNQYQIQEEKI